MSRSKCCSPRAAGAGVILGLMSLASSLFAANWTQTTSLPDGYYAHSLAYSSGFLYEAGGTSNSNGDQDGTNVFYAKVFSDGTIGVWHSATSLPEPVLNHAGVAANGYLYVLGGYHYNLVTGIDVTSALVYYAKINPDGSLALWQTANPLPQVLAYLSASVWNNTIYVIGGIDGQAQLKNVVYSATIQTNGNLSAWVTQTPLPVPVYVHAEAANGMLYALGGLINGGTQIQSNVYCTKISSDGALAGWNQTTPLPHPESFFGVVAAGGRVFSIGGSDGQAFTSLFYSAAVLGDGSLGSWSSGTSFPVAIQGHAVTVNDSYIFVSGGTGRANTFSAVYSMPLPAAPGAPLLTATNAGGTGSVQVRLAGQTNCGFGLTASTNLTDWVRVGAGFTGTNGLLLFTDTNASKFPKRFYRSYWPLP